MANYTVEQCFVNQSVVYGTESSVARWTIEGSSPVTFTVSGLNSEVGYKVYVDGVEIYQQFKGQTSLAFSYSGPWSEHTFEVVAWDYTPGTEIQAAYEYTIDGNMVTFTDKSYGGATVWIWNFGDGVGSTKQSPTHQYQASGTYTVSLTVYDAKGHSSTAKTQIKITLGPDFPLEPSPGGWNVYISDKITLSISAVGLLIGGLIMYVSAIFIPSIPIITPRGRKVIGALMVIAGLYFLVIKDNSWMHF
jgi:PKD repeat protein